MSLECRILVPWCLYGILSVLRALSGSNLDADNAYTNFVLPGIATVGSGTLPHSYFSGPSRSLLSSNMSQVISWPVYVHIRPMIAISVLLHIYSALLIGLPSRMLLIIALCSLTYMLCRPPGPLYRHGFSPSMTPLMTCALPLVPSTISSTSFPQLSCRWHVK